jgi:hypothetical protein
MEQENAPLNQVDLLTFAEKVQRCGATSKISRKDQKAKNIKTF